jgi:hypothetical protein
MRETRTVNYIRDPGTPEEKVFTFTIPKNAALRPGTMEEYAYFEDADCTVPYEEKEGEYPDEITVYMKKAV